MKQAKKKAIKKPGKRSPETKETKRGDLKLADGRVLTKEGRDRIAEAQRKRHARDRREKLAQG